MKVLAINGSPRKNGNTEFMINTLFSVLKQNPDVSTEYMQIGGNKIIGCTACRKCFESEDKRCVFKDDIIYKAIEKMLDCDVLILGSPVYFTDLTAELKAFIDRAGLVNGANGNVLRRKIGAAVVSVRRAGSIHTFASINNFFLINEMFVPGSSYWNMGMNNKYVNIQDDEEGINTMKVLGENILYLASKLQMI